MFVNFLSEYFFFDHQECRGRGMFKPRATHSSKKTFWLSKYCLQELKLPWLEADCSNLDSFFMKLSIYVSYKLLKLVDKYPYLKNMVQVVN